MPARDRKLEYQRWKERNGGHARRILSDTEKAGRAAYFKKWRAKNREAHNAYLKKYTEENRDRVREWRRNGLAKSIQRRIHRTVSNYVWCTLRRFGKTYRTNTLLGYSTRELMAHLESKFQPGMTWDNYGKWHIDHIRPVSSFKFSCVDDPVVRECWALTNLQPLWAADNIRKSNKFVVPSPASP